MNDQERILNDQTKQLKKDMLKDYGVRKNTDLGLLITTFADIYRDLGLWKMADQKGEKPNMSDRQKLIRMQTDLSKAMQKYEKIPALTDEQEEAEKDAEAERKRGRETQDWLDPHSENYDPGKRIMKAAEADYQKICKAEAGGYGEAAKAWAFNCRLSHLIIFKLNQLMKEWSPDKDAVEVRALRLKKGEVLPQWKIRPEDFPPIVKGQVNRFM